LEAEKNPTAPFGDSSFGRRGGDKGRGKPLLERIGRKEERPLLNHPSPRGLVGFNRGPDIHAYLLLRLDVHTFVGV
jgi:hypothetical protein